MYVCISVFVYHTLLVLLEVFGARWSSDYAIWLIVGWCVWYICILYVYRILYDLYVYCMNLADCLSKSWMMAGWQETTLWERKALDYGEDIFLNHSRTHSSTDDESQRTYPVWSAVFDIWLIAPQELNDGCLTRIHFLVKTHFL